VRISSALLKVQGHVNSTQHLSYFSAGKVNISRHALVTEKNPMSIWRRKECGFYIRFRIAQPPAFQDFIHFLESIFCVKFC